MEKTVQVFVLGFDFRQDSQLAAEEVALIKE